LLYLNHSVVNIFVLPCKQFTFGNFVANIVSGA